MSKVWILGPCSIENRDLFSNLKSVFSHYYRDYENKISIQIQKNSLKYLFNDKIDEEKDIFELFEKINNMFNKNLEQKNFVGFIAYNSFIINKLKEYDNIYITYNKTKNRKIGRAHV